MFKKLASFTHHLHFLNKSNSLQIILLALVLGGFFYFLPVVLTNQSYNPIVKKIIPYYEHLVPLGRIKPKSTDKPVVLTFTGDVMLGRNVEWLMDKHGIDYPIVGAQDLLKNSDYLVVNFESAISPTHIRTPSGGMTFSTSVKYLSLLKSLGVTHASLANNHALDYGAAAYQNTDQQLAAIGIDSFGHPTIVSSSSISYLTIDKTRVAIIGIHTLFTIIDQDILESVMQTAQANSDWQIAYIHWGDEYQLIHSQSQAGLAQTLVNYGIDLIVGHHPHVTQDIQLIDGVPVFYSLGNFIFDQYFSPDVQEGYFLNVSFNARQIELTINPHTSINSKSQPRPMTEIETRDFLTSLSQRSEETISENIKSGKLFLPF